MAVAVAVAEAATAVEDKLTDSQVVEPVEKTHILPEDLLEDIILRLSVRDLLRFRCVSKSFRALIDAPSFIWKHHSVQYAMHKANDDVPLLLWNLLPTVRGFVLECHLLSKEQGDDTILNLTSYVECYTDSILPNDRGIYNLSICCQGSANGIICLEFAGVDKNSLGRDFFCSGLWNPASREFKLIAFPHVPNQIMRGLFSVVGFGFDPLSNDFKIIATTTVKSDIVLVYMVYTLSTDSWKKVCVPSLLGSIAWVRPSVMECCLNGVYYWTARLENNNDKIFWILSYNFSTEVFRFSDPPQEALPLSYDRHDEFRWNIGLYKERLALFFKRDVYGMQEASADIWVVTEFDDDFGVPLAWQCLITIKPIFEDIGSVFGVFGVQRMDGDILFEMNSGELCLYNPTTGKFRKLGIRFHKCFSYVESLFPLSRRVVLG